MKIHSIFYKPYHIWWIIMAILSIIKFSIFGFPTMYENKGYGFIFYTIGTLFTGLVFGSILYLVYWLFARKWNNKLYMILISIMWFVFLVL